MQVKSTEEEEENVSRSYLRDVLWKWMKDNIYIYILFREIKKKKLKLQG